MEAGNYEVMFTTNSYDISLSTVFLDENGSVKLGDFGLSKMLGSEHQMAMTYVGTPLYMSPVSNFRNLIFVHFLLLIFA